MIRDVFTNEILSENQEKIAHYYGDTVRKLFLTIAAASAVVIPVWGNLLPVNLLFEIVGIVLLVFLAGFTNPVKKWGLICNTFAALFGVIAFEMAATTLYYSDSLILFAFREGIALLFLFALYFSLKTLRNMVFRTIGKKNLVGDFFESDDN